MLWYAAFMIGLMGSAHCLGMCGPIAFALPVRSTNRRVRVLKYLLYNAGRVLAYGGLGLLTGLAGQGLAMAGLQQTVSVVAGLMIIASVVLVQDVFGRLSGTLLGSIQKPVRSAFQKYFRKSGWSPLFVLGLLNGLLPCGMVYMALVASLAAGDMLSGAGFMMLFGLGTVPLMLAVSLMGTMLSLKMRSLFHKAMPYVACVVAVLLIVRGLNMNIPYVSPENKSGKITQCH